MPGEIVEVSFEIIHEIATEKKFLNIGETLIKPGFPKLLVHQYLLDTVAGLHVPSKFCDISLKKRLSVRISH